jgi:mannose-6-phosphate isomerase-like protein (cupin superfamily)
MTEREWIEKLTAEGYAGIDVFKVPAMEPNLHTHEDRSVHVILSGTFFIEDDEGKHEIKAGERFDIKPGTTHTAYPGPEGCTMIMGTKKTARADNQD